MKNSDRKIGRMHKAFGTSPPNKCKDCMNLRRERYHDRTYRKCLVYGDSASEATDWKCSFDACGMFDKHWDGPRMMDVFNAKKDMPDTQCEGQLSFSDESL